MFRKSSEMMEGLFCDIFNFWDVVFIKKYDASSGKIY
jgi:hypothetical protein